MSNIVFKLILNKLASDLVKWEKTVKFNFKDKFWPKLIVIKSKLDRRRDIKPHKLYDTETTFKKLIKDKFDIDFLDARYKEILIEVPSQKSWGNFYKFMDNYVKLTISNPKDIYFRYGANIWDNPIFEQVLDSKLTEKRPDPRDPLSFTDPKATEFHLKDELSKELFTGIKTPEELKRKYHQLVIKYHPDKHRDADPEYLKVLSQKISILSEFYKKIKPPYWNFLNSRPGFNDGPITSSDTSAHPDAYTEYILHATYLRLSDGGYISMPFTTFQKLFNIWKEERPTTKLDKDLRDLLPHDGKGNSRVPFDTWVIDAYETLKKAKAKKK
jgi:hypothetical protein